MSVTQKKNALEFWRQESCQELTSVHGASCNLCSVFLSVTGHCDLPYPSLLELEMSKEKKNPQHTKPSTEYVLKKYNFLSSEHSLWFVDLQEEQYEQNRKE